MRATVGYLIKVLFPLVLTAPAVGEDGTWQGPFGGNWSEAANWLGGVPDGVGDTALFPMNAGGSLVANVDQPATLGRLWVNGWGSLELTQAGPLLFATDDGNSAGTIALEAMPDRSLAVRVRSDVGLGEGTDRLIAELGDRTVLALYGSLLTPELDFVQNGLGTLELRGASPDWQGGLTIAGGIARVFDGRALGGAIGATTLQSGAVLQIEPGVEVGQEPLRLDGGTLTTTASAAISSAPIELLSDSRILRLRLEPTTLGGVISGHGGVEFVYGQTTITRNNTYEGATTLTNSTVIAQAATALGSTSGATIIGEQSRLRIDTRSSEPLEIRGGEVSFGPLDSLLFDGTVTMSHGLIELEAQRSFGAPIILDQQAGSASGEARVRGNLSEFAGGTSGVGDIVFEEVNRIHDNPLAHDGGVTYEDAELQITVANTYTGTTRLRGTQLVVSNTRALGAPGSTVIVEQGSSLTLNQVPDKEYVVRDSFLHVPRADQVVSGTVMLDQGVLQGRATFTGPITLASTPLSSPTSSVYGGTFEGPIVGAGTLSFYRSDPLVPVNLNGDNTYRGVTYVAGGTVNANSSSAMGSHRDATIVGGGEGTLNLNEATDEPIVVLPGGVLNINASLERLPTITGVARPFNRAKGEVNVNVPSSFLHDAEVVFGGLQINADTMLGHVRIRKEGELHVADDATASFASNELEIHDGKLQGRLAGLDRIVKRTTGRAEVGPLPDFTGEIVVERGSLQMRDAAAFGSTLGSTSLSGREADIRIFGSYEIAEDIFLNNSQGRGDLGALAVFDAACCGTPSVTLTGRLDLGDESSVLGGGSQLSVLELAGEVSGGALVKKGERMHLKLTGDQYSYSGATDVREGSVEISGAGSLHGTARIEIHSGAVVRVANRDLPNADRIGDNVAVVLRGGEFGIGGAETQFISETVGAISLLEGYSVLGIAGFDDPQAGIATRLNVPEMARERGAVAAAHLVDGAQLHIDLPPVLDDGIVPWLLINPSFAGAPWDFGFATYGENGVIPYSAFVTDLNAAMPTDNVSLSPGQSTIAVSADTTINSLTANRNSVDLQGHTLTLASGGAIGLNTISNGRITAGDKPDAELITTGGQFYADITDNPHGPVDLVVNGGDASLHGTNSYSGATIANDATIYVHELSALPDDTVVVLVGGELTFPLGSAPTEAKRLRSVRLSQGGKVALGGGIILDIDQIHIESGEFSGVRLVGNVQIEKTTAGEASLFPDPASDFTGSVLVRVGRLTAGNLGQVPIVVEDATLELSGANPITLAGGTLEPGRLTGDIHVSQPSRIVSTWKDSTSRDEPIVEGAISGGGDLRLEGSLPDTELSIRGHSPEFSGDVVIDSTTVDIRHEDSLGTGEIAVLAGGRLRLLPLSSNFESSRLDLPNRVVLEGGTVLGHENNFQPQRLAGEIIVRSDSRMGVLEVLGPVTLEDGVELATISGYDLLFAGPIHLGGATELLIGRIEDADAFAGEPLGRVRITGPIVSGAAQSRLKFVTTGLDTLDHQHVRLVARGGESLELLLNGQSIDLTLDASGDFLSGDGTIVNAATTGNGAAISPGGSVGSLTMAGALALGGGSVYQWEINDALGTAGGPDGWDLLELQEGLTLTASQDSPIVIALAGLDSSDELGPVANFDPDATYNWQLVRGEDLSGFEGDAFVFDVGDFLADNPVSPTARLSVTIGDTGLFLSYSQDGLAGDYNGNGLIEQSDLDLVLSAWGRAAADLPLAWQSSFPRGLIDQQELDAVLAGWGTRRGLAAGAVPEPASGVLLLAVLACLLGRRGVRMGLVRIALGGRRAGSAGAIRSILIMAVIVGSVGSRVSAEVRPWPLPGSLEAGIEVTDDALSLLSPAHVAIELSGSHDLDIHLNNASGFNYTGGLRSRGEAQVLGTVDLGEVGAYLFGRSILRLRGPVSGGALHALGREGVRVEHQDVLYEGATVVGRNGVPGRLEVSGDAILQHTSGIEVHARSVFTSTGAEQEGGRISDDVPLTIRGGTVAFLPGSPATRTERLGTVRMRHGVATIVAAASTDYRTELTIGELDRGRDALVQFHGGSTDNPLGGESDHSPRIFLESPPLLPGGILGGWATVTADDFFDDFATYDLSRGVHAFEGTRRNRLNGARSIDNVRLTGIPQAPLEADTQINSLLVTQPDSSDEHLLDLGDHRLTIRSGGILGYSWGPVVLFRGTVTAGNGEPEPSLYVTNSGGAEIFIQADIVDPAPGQSLSLVTSGWGEVRLEGTNTYTGPTVINGTGTTSSGIGYSGTSEHNAYFTRREAIPADNDFIINGGIANFDFPATEAVTLRSLTIREGGILTDNGRPMRLNAGSYHLEAGRIDMELVGNGPIVKTTDGAATLEPASHGFSGSVLVEDGILVGQVGSGSVTVNAGRFLASAAIDRDEIVNPITLNGGGLGLAAYWYDENTRFAAPVTVAADAEWLAFDAEYEPPRGGDARPNAQNLQFTSDVILGDDVTVTVVGDGSVRVGGGLQVGDRTRVANDWGALSISGTVMAAGTESTLDLSGMGDFDLSDASYHIAAERSLQITRNEAPLAIELSGPQNRLSGGGTLRNSLIVSDGATLSPGDSPGLLTIDGDLTLEKQTTLEIEIAGAGAGELHDAVHVLGEATIAGGLDVSWISHGGQSLLPAQGDAFEILTATDEVSGAFDDVSLPTNLSGYHVDWDIVYGPDYVRLSVLDAYLLGDFNGNGLVEQGELDFVLDHWGSSAGSPPDGWVKDLPSGIIDQEELDRVLSGWGRSLAARSATPTPAEAVPEPASCLMAVLLLAVALGFGRLSRRGR